MRGWNISFRAAAFSISMLSATALLSSTAIAATTHGTDNHHSTIASHSSTPAKPIQRHLAEKHLTTPSGAAVHHVMESNNKPAAPLSKRGLTKGAKAQYVRRSTLQCVPFARAASGIELKGNAANWWDAASGNYARGAAPEMGSVLNFRATRGMRLGHVAVVTNVVSSREIMIDHANWAGPGASKGGVSRGMSVIDVSPDNNWTQVRVSLGNDNYGSVYPTYGFIYDRPDNGVFVMNNQSQGGYDEVAEAPSRAVR